MCRFYLNMYNEHTEQPAPESLVSSNIPRQHGRDFVVAACEGTATSPLLSGCSCSAQFALIGRKSCTFIRTHAVCWHQPQAAGGCSRLQVSASSPMRQHWLRRMQDSLRGLAGGLLGLRPLLLYTLPVVPGGNLCSAGQGSMLRLATHCQLQGAPSQVVLRVLTRLGTCKHVWHAQCEARRNMFACRGHMSR